MRDIMLNENWDIKIGENADITLVDSPLQEVMIRLQWFAGEWIFGTERGIPYYEHILVKQPNEQHIRSLIKNEIMKVEAVEEVGEISVEVDRRTRKGTIRFEIRLEGEYYREEVKIHG